VTHAEDETTADMAGRLLGWAVLLLPAGRREWGRAMQAEFARIEPRPARWRFALGCVRVSLTQPRKLGAFTYPLLVPGVIAGAVIWTGKVAYAPLRGGLIALVVTLVAMSWLARRPWPFGPLAQDRIARLLRAGGYALVGTAALLIINGFSSATANLEEKAQVGVPILACVLTIYMVAFVTMTARGSAARIQALAIGGGCGIAAAVVYLLPVLVRPPLPVSNGWAIAAVAAAACAATLIGRGRADQRLVAALSAVTVAALLISVSVDGLLQFFPRWVPDTSPANVPAADRLANNRAGAEDPYFAVLLLGCLLAAALSIVILVTRRPRPEPAGSPATGHSNTS
jgi:hypothetical protein